MKRPPTTESAQHRSWNMSRVRAKDTHPERIVRLWLWHQGFRYRKNDKRLQGHPDIVVSRYRTVIEVRGCFWHRHADCPIATMPKSNSAFWWKKFNRNVNRDQETERALRDLGWNVLIVWECELVAARQAATLERLQAQILAMPQQATARERQLYTLEARPPALVAEIGIGYGEHAHDE